MSTTQNGSKDRLIEKLPTKITKKLSLRAVILQLNKYLTKDECDQLDAKFKELQEKNITKEDMMEYLLSSVNRDALLSSILHCIKLEDRM
jgi:hypothetical protein